MNHFISGNQIHLLRNGAEFFPALESAIHHAHSDIYLQTYIYAEDQMGLMIAEALKKAAHRGVRVHVLLDGFGCKDLSRTFIADLESAGVEVMFYRPKISPWTFKKSRLRRLHRKVSVFDNQLAFVGGINIIDDYNTPEQVPPRIDYALSIEGALVAIISSHVQKLWRRVAWSHLKKYEMTHTVLHRQPFQPLHNVSAAFVIRDNVLHRSDIENAYLSAIAYAKSEIIIANAYFVPGRTFRKALVDAASRGVSVKLLLQGRKEYFLMFATHVFYSMFLNHHIEIYEYRKSFMHSKVAVIDGYWATVGSSNIDPFSLLLGHEANIIVQNTSLALALRSSIIQSIEDGAYRIQLEEWAKIGIAKRFISWMAYGLLRLLLGMIGYVEEK